MEKTTSCILKLGSFIQVFRCVNLAGITWEKSIERNMGETVWEKEMKPYFTKKQESKPPLGKQDPDQTGKVLEHTAPIVLKSLPLPL